MQSAVDRLRRESAYENPTKLHYGEGIPSSQQESQVESVKQLEGRLIDAAKSFFRKLNRSQLIEQDVWYRLQDRFEFL